MLDALERAYACGRCAREYPIVCGIPDFRLDPDPYIPIEDDRRKGEMLLRESAGRTFESLVRYYYSVTPDDPPDLAERWTERALREVEIASALLRDAGLRGPGSGAPGSGSRAPGAGLEAPGLGGRGPGAGLGAPGSGGRAPDFDTQGSQIPAAQGPHIPVAQRFSPAPRPASGARTPAPGARSLLDIGCSTGALLIAARESHAPLVGVDVAFRWLVAGQHRLREASVDATLVCANAEHLPFADGAFETIAATDLIEHVRDGSGALGEAARVAAPSAALVATANNRYAPAPEPNVHLWGVGYLPRAWQARYVAARRRDLHPYRIQLRSAGELARICREAGWRDVRVAAAALRSPHAGAAARGVLALYNALVSRGVSARILAPVAPRLRIQARR